MSTDSENEEKLNEEEKVEQFFELFPDLPPEIRLFIVEKLGIKDRFRFARCSQGSWNIWARITRNEPCSIIVHASENKIFQVHEELHWPHTIFNNETFLRLSAKRVCIDIGALTEQNICDFINSWRSGPISDKIDKFDWNLRDSKFDKNLLCQLLGEDPSLLSDGIVIEHEQGFDKAEIRNRRDTLKFSVICYGDWTDDDYENNDFEEEEDESVDFEYEYEHEYGYFEDEQEDFEDEDYNYEDYEDQPEEDNF